MEPLAEKHLCRAESALLGEAAPVAAAACMDALVPAPAAAARIAARPRSGFRLRV